MFLIVMASSGGATATRVTETGGLTTGALVVIAIFALLVIVGILYGAKQKRVRAAAEAEEKQRAAELAAQDDAPTAVAEPAREPVVAPAPPPVEPAKPAPEGKAAVKPVPAKTEAAPMPKAAAKPKAVPAEPAAKPKAASKSRAKSAPTAEVAPEPVAAPTPPPAPATATTGYALTDVKGLGPKAAGLLTGLGIADVAALAALDPAHAAAVDGQLGAFAGRMSRDRWVEQAQLLAADNIAEFEATYGKL